MRRIGSIVGAALIFGTLAVPLGVFADDEPISSTTPSVLLWWVNDPDIPEGSGNYIESLYSVPGGLPVNAARIRVTGGDLEEPVYLDLYSSSHGWDSLNSDLDSPAVYNRLGFTPNGETGTFAGPMFANISGYDSTAFSFFVELGNWNDVNNEWTVMAVSDAESYQNLLEGHFTNVDPVNYPGYEKWAPNGYVVPEPSSGLLLLIGGALLSLRRRRRCGSRS